MHLHEDKHHSIELTNNLNLIDQVKWILKDLISISSNKENHENLFTNKTYLHSQNFCDSSFQKEIYSFLSTKNYFFGFRLLQNLFIEAGGEELKVLNKIEIKKHFEKQSPLFSNYYKEMIDSNPQNEKEARIIGICVDTTFNSVNAVIHLNGERKTLGCSPLCYSLDSHGKIGVYFLEEERNNEGIENNNRTLLESVQKHFQERYFQFITPISIPFGCLNEKEGGESLEIFSKHLESPFEQTNEELRKESDLSSSVFIFSNNNETS